MTAESSYIIEKLVDLQPDDKDRIFDRIDIYEHKILEKIIPLIR